MPLDLTTAVNAHYGRVKIGEALLRSLEEAGKNLDALSMDDLAPLEDFHSGGRAATIALAGLAGISAGMRIIDVGCGIGGPARALAHHFGCRVAGIDLTREFCSAGRLLTDRIGLADKVSLHWGNALNMPFPDYSFDVAWVQHVTMNVPDKPSMFKEIKRILRPNGVLALCEVFAGDRPVKHFPVPWARNPELSFLLPVEEVQKLLESTGFVRGQWQDVTDESVGWFRRRLAEGREQGPGRSSLVTFMGPDFPLMMANVLSNLQEARLRVARGVYRFPG